MADRKISDLSYTNSVAAGDLLVVVTGVETPGATLVTHKFPMSGLVNNIINIDELVTANTGIYLVPTLNDDAPNTIEINVSGYAYTSHTHTDSAITNFGSAVSGYVQQIIKVLSADVASTNSTPADTSLSIPIAPSSTYLFEFGAILENEEANTDISGVIATTGNTGSINYATVINGTWNYVEDSGLFNSTVPLSGIGPLFLNVTSDQTDKPVTVVNKFTINTTSTYTDNVSVQFFTSSTDTNTSGVLKAGSWLKAEKLI